MEKWAEDKWGDLLRSWAVMVGACLAVPWKGHNRNKLSHRRAFWPLPSFPATSQVVLNIPQLWTCGLSCKFKQQRRSDSCAPITWSGLEPPIAPTTKTEQSEPSDEWCLTYLSMLLFWHYNHPLLFVRIPYSFSQFEENRAKLGNLSLGERTLQKRTSLRTLPLEFPEIAASFRSTICRLNGCRASRREELYIYYGLRLPKTQRKTDWVYEVELSYSHHLQH